MKKWLRKQSATQYPVRERKWKDPDAPFCKSGEKDTGFTLSNRKSQESRMSPNADIRLYILFRLSAIMILEARKQVFKKSDERCRMVQQDKMLEISDQTGGL